MIRACRPWSAAYATTVPALRSIARRARIEVKTLDHLGPHRLGHRRQIALGKPTQRGRLVETV
ncbi:hypothetical protein ASG60_03880 [Methylobacterium sp. Leaf469]|uniref:hypothetical protein n=1 Tax=Methylobacterium sp. Leaf469 TaxID=1736387 RepID=UPI0006FC8880|nr:hypothetical protein [Methylobacterium sp. Leaf469]KQT98863.1 hypothetical protein ASG60_03880 [Methylobacterium sp. Leaf469]